MKVWVCSACVGVIRNGRCFCDGPHRPYILGEGKPIPKPKETTT